MRYAIKFAYDGTKFSGSQSQPQPELDTVEGDIIECLRSHTVIEDRKSARFQLASRTDAGVSALGNVLALNTDFTEKETLSILNSKLDHCWFYGIARVDDDFQPRHAKLRWYRYHLYHEELSGLGDEDTAGGKKPDFDNIQSMLDLFLGKHDFRNFANPQLDDTVRTISSIKATKLDDWMIFDLKAPSFLWHQVRRMVNAWVKCIAGELDIAELKGALTDIGPQHKQRFDFGLAAPEQLFLMDVGYDFEFDIDKQVLDRTRRGLLRSWLGIKVKEKFFDYILEKI